jgi:hypothetical protein
LERWLTIHWHPHIHALVTEGVFLPDSPFLPLPKLATEPFLKLWEQEVFALLLAKGKITEEVVANMRSWKHSGFSVDQSVRLAAGDQEGVQRLIQYFLRCPFSQARMIRLRPGQTTAGQVEVTEAGKVIYKTEHNAVGRFPEPGDEALLAGPSRNFQVFDPLDFFLGIPFRPGQVDAAPGDREIVEAVTDHGGIRFRELQPEIAADPGERPAGVRRIQPQSHRVRIWRGGDFEADVHRGPVAFGGVGVHEL